MSAPAHRSARLGSLLCLGALLAGCSAFNGASIPVVSMVRPYRVEVVQGNFVSREQVEALKPGMGRQQVREILGTPLLTSLFHDDRWDYVFTLKRPGLEAQTRKLTVFFKGDVLDRHEGDAMPTESEFVASLGTQKAKARCRRSKPQNSNWRAIPCRLRRARAPRPMRRRNASARTYPPLKHKTR